MTPPSARKGYACSPVKGKAENRRSWDSLAISLLLAMKLIPMAAAISCTEQTPGLDKKKVLGLLSALSEFLYFLMNFCLLSYCLRNTAVYAWGDQFFLVSLNKHHASVNWISRVVKVRTHLTTQKRFMLALNVEKSINTALVPRVIQPFSLRNASFSMLSCFDLGKVNINPPLL